MSRVARVVFAIADLLTAAVVGVGVFAGLPDRWLPVDLGALVLVALHLLAGAGLLLDARWATRAARATSATALALGLGLVGAVAISASYLNGIYGPVGHGGAVIFLLVGALATPYLIVLPAVQLVWLGRWS